MARLPIYKEDNFQVWNCVKSHFDLNFFIFKMKFLVVAVLMVSAVSAEMTAFQSKITGLRDCGNLNRLHFFNKNFLRFI